MDQNHHSDTHSDTHRRCRGNPWASGSDQSSTMGYLASASANYNAIPQVLFGESVSSLSDLGCNLHTPQDSLPHEPLPMESFFGLGGSERVLELSESVDADMLDPFVAQQLTLHGMEWFEGASSSQSTGSTGQILHSENNGTASFLGMAMDMGTWDCDAQEFLFNNQCDPVGSSGQQNLPREPTGHHEHSDDDILSGMLPEGYQDSQSKDHLVATATCFPRYVRCDSSTNAPWSTYSMSDNRISRIFSSDEALFAPEHMVPSAVQHLGKRLPQQSASKAKRRRRSLIAHSDDDKGDTELLNAVGSPPSGNPVGPPPNACDGSGAVDDLSPSIIIQSNKKGGRHGGLDPQRREDAKRMREIGSCWRCILARGLCKPIGIGTDCQACIMGICDRTSLPDLSKVFLPASLLDQHQVAKIKEFCRARVFEWTDNQLTVYVTWGYGEPIKCDVQEFKPWGDSLLYQNQYKKDLDTGILRVVRTPSPPLGMLFIQIDYCRSQLLGYLNDVLEKDFQGFPKACYRGADCEVQRDLLYILHRYHKATMNVLSGRCLKLIVLTQITTNSMTIVESSKEEVFQSLWNRPPQAFGTHTSSRWLNKQLKFLLSSLHVTLMENILGNLAQMLRGSKKLFSWAENFASILMLAMANESIQITLRCKEATDKEEGVLDQHDETAKQESELIDKKIDFLQDLYHKGYKTQGTKGKPSFNPIRNVVDRGELDAPASQLATNVGDIVESYRDFLQSRRGLGVPTATEPNTSRLVARFLLSF